MEGLPFLVLLEKDKLLLILIFTRGKSYTICSVIRWTVALSVTILHVPKCFEEYPKCNTESQARCGAQY